LWERDQIQAFKRLRDRTCEVVRFIMELHDRAKGVAPDEGMAEVAGDLREPFFCAHCEAAGLWHGTPISEYLERQEPVFLDNLDQRTSGRVTASCNHDLALAVAKGVWEMVENGTTAADFLAIMRFKFADGDHVNQRLDSIGAEVRCECQEGIRRWRREAGGSTTAPMQRCNGANNCTVRGKNGTGEEVSQNLSAQPKRKGERPTLRSWTQPDLDHAIREYKAKRAPTYSDLKDAVKRGKPGAQRDARRLFGRNAIARALGVKARAMVTKSEAWQDIARDLKLPHGPKRYRGLNKANRIGAEIAEEIAGEAAGNTTHEAVVRRETNRLARKHLPEEEAEAIIDQLSRGEINDDEARELINLTLEQLKER
jgi:hypothetical protein